VALVVKNPCASAGDKRDLGSIPGSERSLGQRRLADYSPWGHKELDTTETT